MKLHVKKILSHEGVQWLVDRRVSLVGIDHYSIAGSGADKARCHEILLSNEVLVIDELRFPAEVFGFSQPFAFWALPVNCPGHSGSFCRPVILIR